MIDSAPLLRRAERVTPLAGTVVKKREFLGTPHYASLEALQHCMDGGDGFDLHRSDVYSAGATLFELLMGELPVKVPKAKQYVLPAYEKAILHSVRTRRTPMSCCRPPPRSGWC